MKLVPATLLMIASSLSIAQAEPTIMARSELSEDMMGSWAFSTEPYANGLCRMSGTMTVFGLNADATGLECELTASEDCGFGRSVVAQTCQITQSAGALQVESEVQQFIERMPFVLGEYLPDHFILNDISTSQMRGQLMSAATAPVLFTRNEGNVS